MERRRRRKRAHKADFLGIYCRKLILIHDQEAAGVL
jgi:hypothetical protein